MTPASAKAKGRRLQQWVRDKLLTVCSWLEPDDIQSRSSGANGEDIILSPLARKSIPYSFECKSLSKASVYSMYKQASNNASKYEPVVVLKANGMKPLAVVDAEHFFDMVCKVYGKAKVNKRA